MANGKGGQATVDAEDLSRPRYVDNDRSDATARATRVVLDRPSAYRGHVLITGDHGSGKSAVVNAARGMPAIPSLRLYGPEVAYVRLPARPTEHGFYGRLHAMNPRLGMGMRTSDSATVRQMRAFEAIVAQGIRVLVVDDGRLLAEAGVYDADRLVASMVQLGEQTGVSIVMTGLPTTADRITGRPDASGRFTVVEVDRWRDDDPFRGFLRNWDDKGLTPYGGTLSSDEVADVIVRMTDMTMAGVCDAIRGGIRVAALRRAPMGAALMAEAARAARHASLAGVSP